MVLFRNILQLLPAPADLYLNPKLGQSGLFWKDPKIRVTIPSPHEGEFREIRFELEFTRPWQSGPATKGRICLEHEFGLIREDFRFRPLDLAHLDSLNTPAVAATHRLLKGLVPCVVCHFQGTSNPNEQNPEEAFAARTVDKLVEVGWGVLIINYHYVYHHSDNTDFGFIDEDRIPSTYKRLPMKVESLWTLIRGAKAFFGVDSGPLHLAPAQRRPRPFSSIGLGS